MLHVKETHVTYNGKRDLWYTEKRSLLYIKETHIIYKAKRDLHHIYMKVKETLQRDGSAGLRYTRSV